MLRYSRGMPDKRPDDRGNPDKGNPYNEEESARRRSAASRRPHNAPAAPDTERPVRRTGRAGPEKYRGVEYSVAKHGDGAWIWKLRATSENGPPAPSGTVRGRQDDAIEAAHRAIDKALGTQRK
jgi:hypothetical protein